MEEMDTLRQNYHLLELEFKKQNTENSHYTEEISVLEDENKKLTDLVDELQPLIDKMLDSGVGFLEKLVCNQMNNLKLDESTQSTENSADTNNTKTSFEMHKNCVEWWCPVHSKFLDILGNISIKNQTLEDQYLIQKAKFEYWQGEKNKNIPRCPIYERKKGKAIHYSLSKCWPIILYYKTLPLRGSPDRHLEDNGGKTTDDQ
ncbi:Uncharacterized protein FWK35_00007437 [Aphis craccivora]|uniref:Uncharacterized protein n=1 Tax=Aphis craccivora TaxID=307492 RepID=A0A6G0YXT6_APHCR|nr:Uncharacterized protein FWK35_00007437 [Aphis craccivora]